eukprot:CAMPEP_0119132094 /NCGR_PEP_ID=MMETSP1310-20130426/11424_1 /TAXON_ID=464262 /ORGANISM="Genus nov. species nov., Strain RCC2339" /LENGTH=266 /DNA_ID=CAMNT_0007122707 /DNA_START=72 /DNA_END=872 /DNA_ORIENTATION=+
MRGFVGVAAAVLLLGCIVSDVSAGDIDYDPLQPQWYHEMNFRLVNDEMYLHSNYSYNQGLAFMYYNENGESGAFYINCRPGQKHVSYVIGHHHRVCYDISFAALDLFCPLSKDPFDYYINQNMTYEQQVYSEGQDLFQWVSGKVNGNCMPCLYYWETESYTPYYRVPWAFMDVDDYDERLDGYAGYLTDYGFINGGTQYVQVTGPDDRCHPLSPFYDEQEERANPHPSTPKPKGILRKLQKALAINREAAIQGHKKRHVYEIMLEL